MIKIEHIKKPFPPQHFTFTNEGNHTYYFSIPYFSRFRVIFLKNTFNCLKRMFDKR